MSWYWSCLILMVNKLFSESTKNRDSDLRMIHLQNKIADLKEFPSNICGMEISMIFLWFIYDFKICATIHHHIDYQEQSYDTVSRSVSLFWQRVNQFTLYMSSGWQGRSNYQFEIFGLTRPGIEPRPPRHRANALTTRLPSWYTWKIK